MHNLKNVDADIPLNRIVGIAGVSGSGKSSLALGVLYAERSRRYLEPLSTYTRRIRMFNLNEDNRIVMARHPSDMRIGVNGMCGQVRQAGLDPTDGDVYIFVGKNRRIMKLLHWERGGYVMYYKRLERGRFHPRIFLRDGVGFRSMRWDGLALLMEGISPVAAARPAAVSLWPARLRKWRNAKRARRQSSYRSTMPPAVIRRHIHICPASC